MIKIQSKFVNFISKLIIKNKHKLNIYNIQLIKMPLNTNNKFSTTKTISSPNQKTKQIKKNNKQQKQMKQQIISTQNRDFGDQINSLLQKKQLSQIDLVFLSKMFYIKNINILSEKHSNFIRKQIKNLPSASFQNLIPLIQLSNRIKVIHFSKIIVNPFVIHFTVNKIDKETMQPYPQNFLKQIAFHLFLENFSKKIDKGAEALKVIGTLLSSQELKKVDRLCCQNIKSMDIDNVVRLLNIFRQIVRKGLFVKLAAEIIVQKRQDLSNKFLLMSLISFLELGQSETAQKLEPLLISRIGGDKPLQQKQIIIVLQVFHKFKKGSGALWQNIQKSIKQNQKDFFQHSFAILSGLTRNYIPRPSLFLNIIMLHPNLEFVKNFNQKQFIQFFLVLYFHYQYSNQAEVAKIQSFIIQAIKSKQMKSVYIQIQNFFLFLFDKGSQKKQYLRKAYPNDMMITLISLAYSIQQTVDVTEARAYQQDLLTRFTQQTWQANKKIIVAEEFIRYKLVSAREKQFREQMMM